MFAARTIARRWFRDLRTEGSGRTRDAAALGIGVFIGCLPFYGFHLLLVALVGWLLRLNRLRMYVAANISNPLFAPALIFGEIQLGAWLRRRDFHDVTIAAIRQTDPWTFGADLLIGAVVIGLALGAAMVAGTLAADAHAPRLPPHLDAAFARAADRYFEHSITAWEFARGKLRRDPVYRRLLEGALPGGSTLVDIGCGQGLTLAALVEAARLAANGNWPGVPPPAFARIIGIESRRGVAGLARRALGDSAEIVHAFAPEGLPDSISAGLLFDVLHLMRPEDQVRLLDEVRARVGAGGMLLVREADASAGAGFQFVKFGNRLKNLAVGNWGQTFHFRTAADWQRLFEERGWRVEQRPMNEGTPFANVLFRLTRLHEITDANHEPS